MFGAPRKISLIVAPFGSSKSWTRVVSLPALIGIGGGLAVLLVSFFVLLVSVADLSSRVRETEVLREENARLREQSSRIDELEVRSTVIRS